MTAPATTSTIANTPYVTVQPSAAAVATTAHGAAARVNPEAAATSPERRPNAAAPPRSRIIAVRSRVSSPAVAPKVTSATSSIAPVVHPMLPTAEACTNNTSGVRRAAADHRCNGAAAQRPGS